MYRLATSERFAHYKFYVDSQASLRALRKRQITSRLVLETVNNLNLLAERGTVNFVWVRAHKGNTGNERADALAKAGAALPDVTSSAHIPRKAVKALVNSKLRECWNEQWQKYPHARQSKIFLPNCLEPLSPKLYMRSRKDIGIIIRCISGHNNLAYHQSRLHNTVSPSCRFCHERSETFYHFLVHCPRLTWLRAECTGHYSIPDLSIWTPKLILNFAKCPQILNKLASNELYLEALSRREIPTDQNNQFTHTRPDEYNLATPPNRSPSILSDSSAESIAHQFSFDLADLSDLSAETASSCTDVS